MTLAQALAFKVNLPLEGAVPLKLSIIWFTHEVAPTVPDVPDEPLLPEVPDEPEEPDVPDEPLLPLVPDLPPNIITSLLLPITAVTILAVEIVTLNVYTSPARVPEFTV